MKILVLLAFILSVGCADQKIKLTPEQAARLMQNSIVCAMETGVSVDTVAQFKSGKYSDDPASKKFIFCVFRKSGIAKSNGHIKIDAALSRYPKDVDKEAIKKVMEECDKLDGKDATDRAFNIFKCFHEKTPVHMEM